MPSAQEIYNLVRARVRVPLTLVGQCLRPVGVRVRAGRGVGLGLGGGVRAGVAVRARGQG